MNRLKLEFIQKVHSVEFSIIQRAYIPNFIKIGQKMKILAKRLKPRRFFQKIIFLKNSEPVDEQMYQI